MACGMPCVCSDLPPPILMGKVDEPEPRAREPLATSDRFGQGPSAVMLLERQSSFLFTGGLVAAHAEGRTREEIWDALKRREVYATSGHRTLLWFDLLGDAPAPMGASTRLATEPRFRATAVGAFVQIPGCPSHATGAMPPEQLEYVCKGECYHPSDMRNPIERIEVIRIRPQARPDEPVEGLIEDAWRTFECEPDPDGCTVEFSDPEFADAGRDTLYYVRAIEAPIPMINAGTLRIERASGGDLVEMRPCSRAGAKDDCLELEHPRAWSSPIFVEHAGLDGATTGSDPT